MVKQLLKILKANNALEEAVFVLDWLYEKARAVFGDDLDKVVYVPVIEDGIPDLKAYVNEYIEKLHPVAFQFRMTSLYTGIYRLLPTVIGPGPSPSSLRPELSTQPRTWRCRLHVWTPIRRVGMAGR